MSSYRRASHLSIVAIPIICLSLFHARSGAHAQLLTADEMTRALGGAGCTNTGSFPKNCTGTYAQGTTCWTTSVFCTQFTRDGTTYCGKATLAAMGVCETRSGYNCSQTTGGNCGTQFIGTPDAMNQCPTGQCPNTGTACGEPMTTATQTVCN